MKEEFYTKFHSKVVSRSISIITYCTTPKLTTQLVRFFTKLVFPKTNTISKSFSSSKGTGFTYGESSIDIFCECKYVSMKTCTPNYGVFCSTTTQYQVYKRCQSTEKCDPVAINPNHPFNIIKQFTTTKNHFLVSVGIYGNANKTRKLTSHPCLTMCKFSVSLWIILKSLH